MSKDSLQDDFLLDQLSSEFAGRKATSDSDREIADSIRASLTEKQRNVVKDRSRRKAVLCPRRAGKSYVAMAYAYDTALRNPLSRVVVVCLNLKTAKNTYWQGPSSIILFAKKFGIQVSPHHTEVRLTLSNGSIISFIGAETKAEIDKLRGGSYDLVVIDECKSYPGGILEELIRDVISPALRDRLGTLMLIGTPGSILDGPFYQATCPDVTFKTKEGKDRPFSKTFGDPERYWRENPHDTKFWSRHTWQIPDNTAMPHMWQEALDEKDFYGWSDDHPTWQRESLGRWVASSDAFVYAYAALRNTNPDSVHWFPAASVENPAGLPTGHDDWRFILGMDLGFEDATALVVCAYSPTSGHLYHVWDYKASHMLPDQVADWIRRVVDRFGHPDAMVADMGHGGAKMLVEGMNQRYGYLIQPAERRDKYDHIELLNGDFLSGRIKIQPNSDLARELAMLQWDLSHGDKSLLAKQGKLKEHYSFDNHLSDAFLYAYRFSNHFWGTSRVAKAAPNSPEFWDAREDEWMRRYVQQRDNPTDPFEDDRFSGPQRDPLARYYNR